MIIGVGRSGGDGAGYGGSGTAYVRRNGFDARGYELERIRKKAIGRPILHLSIHVTVAIDTLVFLHNNPKTK